MLIYGDCEIRKGNLVVQSTRTVIPITKAFASDVVRMFWLYVIVSAIYWLRRPWTLSRPLKIGFYPTPPKPWYLIWNITKFCGIRACRDREQCDILYYFEDSTHAAPAAGDGDMARIHNGEKYAINAECLDISKGRVAAVFEEVFGYALAIDPTRYIGPAVRKSHRNAAHDGTVITCPIDRPAPDYAYQRLIANSDDGCHVQDIRVPIVGGTIPLVYIKERPIETRFANDNSKVTLHEVSELLSKAEVDLIRAFATRLKLDVGSLDVLRDRRDGRIYIVDANKTCMGPPVALPLFDKIRAVRRMSRAFEGYIELLQTRDAKAAA